MILYEDAYTTLNEAYFGKTKDVLEIEKIIHDWRAPYLSDISPAININTYSLQIDGDPNHDKLNKAICNAFGFYDCITNVKCNVTPNLATNPTSLCIDLSSKKLRKSLKASSKGFRYSEKDEIIFSMMIPTGILIDSQFSDAEITAGILHEIGHNFSPAISRNIYDIGRLPILSWYSILVATVCESVLQGADPDTIGQIVTQVISLAINSTNTMHKYSIEIGKIMKEMLKDCPALGIIFGMGKISMDAITDILSNISMLKSIMRLPTLYLTLPFKMVFSAIGMIAKPMGYEDERFSDTFAASYGYGYELNSFLDKLNNYDTSLVKYTMTQIPFVDALYTVYTLPYQVVISSLDEHPTRAARAYNTIKYLEDEIKRDKNMNAATKKKMLRDIKNINDIYDYNTKVIDGLPQGSDVKKTYQKVIYNTINGDIKHNILGRHVADDIDKVYNMKKESMDVYDTKERAQALRETTDAQKKLFSDLFKDI